MLELGDFMYKKIALALVLPLVFSGCAQKLWYGQNPQRDIYECQQEAARAYAPAMYNSTVGVGYTTPSYTTCNAYGYSASCVTTGGNYVPPAQVTLDANSSNRNNHFNYCMVSRGNVLMTKAEYEARGYQSSQPSYQSNEPTPRQKHIALREKCRDKYTPSFYSDECKKFRQDFP